MALVGDLVVNLGLNSRTFQSGLGSATGMLRGFAGNVSSTLGRVTGLATGLAGTAAAAVGLGSAIGAVADGFSAAIDMEQMEVSFGVLFGSAETAKAVLSDLTKFAASTPFEFPELAAAGRSLAAFGVSAGDITPQLRMIGDIASGIGQPIGEIAEIYGKARVQGRLFGEDINQLTGRGIPVIQELAKQFGVSESEVKKLVEQGQVGFPQLEQAFQSMTSEGGQFGGMMEKQSQTIGGMLSTLKDNISASFREIAQTMLASFDFKGLIDRATAWAKQFGEIVTFAIRNAADLWNLGLTEMALFFVQWTGGVAAPLVAVWDGAMAAFGAFFTNIKGGLTEIGNLAQALGTAVKAAFTAAFSGENPVTAFKDSFINALAAQQDAVSGGNPAEAFMEAFKKSSEETTGFFNDMETGLVEDRDRILENIAGRETKFAEQQAQEAAAAAGLTQGGAPGATTPEAAKTSKAQAQIAGGAERGSKEALDRILKSGAQRKDAGVKVAEKQLQKLGGIESALAGLVKNPPAVVVGTV